MNNLQWALIVLGILVVVGVYFYSRGLGRSEVRAEEEEHNQGEEDSDPWEELLSDRGLEERHTSAPEEHSTDEAPEAGGQTPAAEAEQPPADAEKTIRMPAPPPGEEKLVILHVACARWLSGAQVHSALQACRLRFGPRYIYHRTEEIDGVPVSVFSVANMLKPGYLDPEQAGQLRTRGLSLFMMLPGPVGGVRAYRDLLHTAGDLAERLGGDVLDEKKTPLNKQMAQYLHEQVVEFERRRAAQA